MKVKGTQLDHLTEALTQARIVPTAEQCTTASANVAGGSLVNLGKSPARFIYSQMIKNAAGPVSQHIHRLLDSTVPERVFCPYHFENLVTAWVLFVLQVDENKPWDYKHKIRKAFGKRYQFGNRVLKWDVWGNIHFGFVGRASGFSVYTLRLGAGIHQLGHRPAPARRIMLRAMKERVGFVIAADHPRDTNAIEFGAMLYDSYGIGLTMEQFEKEFISSTKPF